MHANSSLEASIPMSCTFKYAEFSYDPESYMYTETS